MSIFFNIDEILEMAEQIERNGARFYGRAAEDAKSPGARALFTELASWEDKHQKVFARLRADYLNSKKDVRDVSFDEQAYPYLRAWADGHIFDVRSDPVEKLSGQETMEDILKMAIGLEKDSIVFYLGFKEAVPKKADRDRIEKIINEEMEHVALLSTQLSALKNELM